MTVTVVVGLRARAGGRPGLREYLSSLIDGTRASDGFTSLEILDDLADDDVVVMIERWASREHYLTYTAWRRDRGDLAALHALLVDAPDMRFLAVPAEGTTS